MSAPVSGKYQDHYLVLGIDPKADLSAIEAAYANLVKKYQPGNAVSGNLERFDAINVAFEVLSDPNQRASFDKLKGAPAKEEALPQFSGVPFFQALKQAADVRAALLSILYDRRRARPFTPSISVRLLEGMLQLSTEELNIALWYLKKRGLVSSGDKSSLEITADGMDCLENNPPAPERVIRFIKPESVAEKPQEPPSARGSVLRALNRASKAKSENAPAAITSGR